MAVAVTPSLEMVLTLYPTPTQIFQISCAKECGFEVPEEGDYGVGFVYLSKDAKLRAEEESTIESVVSGEQLELIGWRDVPVNSDILGKASSECEPLMRQFFVKRSDAIERGLPFERKLYIVRRLTTHKLRAFRPIKPINPIFTSVHCPAEP